MNLLITPLFVGMNSLVARLSILGLQPRDKAAMLVVKTKEIFLLNLHQNRVHFPAERNAFVLDHQHGRRDVTCKPAIYEKKTMFFLTDLFNNMMLIFFSRQVDISTESLFGG